MGTDIHGWIEVKEGNFWRGVNEVYRLTRARRNYEMFGCLFGVRNRGNFKPIAEGRGLPGDVSDEAKKDEEFCGGKDHTWISYKEIKNINWEERAVKPSVSYVEFKKNPDGSLSETESCGEGLTEEEKVKVYSGLSVEKNGYIYFPEVLRRESCLSKEWRLLFDIMRLLSDEYEPEGVRLVVWFD